MQNGEAAVAKIKQANPSFDYANVQLVQIDVSKKESIQAAADFVKSKYGNVHVLINNVGIDGDAEGAEMCFNVNIFGVYDTLVAFHPLMVPNQSSNIVVASTLGASSLSAMPRSLRPVFEDFNKLDISTVRSLVDDWIASAHGKPSEHP
ncbi:hypothetical protein Ae201684_018609 [Aphanomyces euteiches]|uniref:Ketoreductase (KR) domain-containing protein n=1 Tax=Aphanomyces euteiches TaxID=100861 RepID=A0A6G0W5A2_9STRA|nr:hypothetical protein Ae201684_018609 [Aphanomyces euteiches]KAH9137406.1 hypothetical protein AeRB84_017868 [Aphanomyces euteiches]